MHLKQTNCWFEKRSRIAATDEFTVDCVIREQKIAEAQEADVFIIIKICFCGRDISKASLGCGI